jgi:nitrate/nitrite-specific signal transduction histidine kinase
MVLLVVAWAVLRSYREVAEDLVIERDRELTRLIANELARETEDYIETLSMIRRGNSPSITAARMLALQQVAPVIKPRVGTGGRAYLVDDKGLVIFHTDITLVGQDFSAEATVRQVLSGKSGGLRTRDAQGQEIVASFAPVPGTGWGLVTEESWGALIRPSQAYGRALLLLLVLGVAVPSLVIAVGMQRITQPIAELTRAAKELAGGNFDQLITATTGDELEELAAQFNHMAGQLQASYQDLERKVVERTQELAVLATENARLFQIEQRRVEQLQAINEVGQRIASILSVDELLEETSRLVQERLGYYRVYIGLIDGDDLVLNSTAGRLLEQREWHPTRLVIGHDGLMGSVAQNGEPLLVPDVTQLTHYRHLPRATETRSELAVPLKSKDTIIGVLDVQSEHRDAFDEQDLTVLQALGRQTAIAIDNARLYQQAQRLAVIEERNRLARDLHDSVTQSLYGVMLLAEAAGRLIASGEPAQGAEHLQELRQTAQEALWEMRALVFELRPSVLEEHGLVTALASRLEAVEERAGLETSLEVEGGDHRLPLDVEVRLYRIAQEALNNALRHAEAHHIKVRLRQSEAGATLEIADDGVGFDPAPAWQQGGLGLCGMKERAAQMGARLSIASRPGEGTCVQVEVSP